jgi:hypothetical protein
MILKIRITFNYINGMVALFNKNRKKENQFFKI